MSCLISEPSYAYVLIVFYIVHFTLHKGPSKNVHVDLHLPQLFCLFNTVEFSQLLFVISHNSTCNSQILVIEDINKISIFRELHSVTYSPLLSFSGFISCQNKKSLNYLVSTEETIDSTVIANNYVTNKDPQNVFLYYRYLVSYHYEHTSMQYTVLLAVKVVNFY